jgi:hypothetical protein
MSSGSHLTTLVPDDLVEFFRAAGQYLSGGLFLPESAYRSAIRIPPNRRHSLAVLQSLREFWPPAERLVSQPWRRGELDGETITAAAGLVKRPTS